MPANLRRRVEALERRAGAAAAPRVDPDEAAMEREWHRYLDSLSIEELDRWLAEYVPPDDLSGRLSLNELEAMSDQELDAFLMDQCGEGERA